MPLYLTDRVDLIVLDQVLSWQLRSLRRVNFGPGATQFGTVNRQSWDGKMSELDVFLTETLETRETSRLPLP